MVYDRVTLTSQPGRLADLVAGIHHGEQARVADVPLKCTISDHPMAFLPFDSDPAVGQNPAFLVIHDPTMCAAMQELFERHWDRAVPLAAFRDGSAATRRDPTTPERELLTLLLSGFTDGQMAAHLGCSERTIRQRLNAMRGRLDARTRFQAGYQAVRRGWLTPDPADA